MMPRPWMPAKAGAIRGGLSRKPGLCPGGKAHGPGEHHARRTRNALPSCNARRWHNGAYHYQRWSVKSPHRGCAPTGTEGGGCRSGRWQRCGSSPDPADRDWSRLDSRGRGRDETPCNTIVTKSVPHDISRKHGSATSITLVLVDGTGTHSQEPSRGVYLYHVSNPGAAGGWSGAAAPFGGWIASLTPPRPCSG